MPQLPVFGRSGFGLSVSGMPGILLAVLVVLAIIVVAVVAARGTSWLTRGAPRFARDKASTPARKRCTADFYKASTGVYCVQTDNGTPRCLGLPIPAIIHANEMPDAVRCDEARWGFGCDPGILCALAESGPNLVAPGVAEKIARTQCGISRLVCGY